MNFSKALKLIKKGRVMRRASWTFTDHCVAILPGGEYVMWVKIVERSVGMNDVAQTGMIYGPQPEDLMAEDWEAVQ